MADRGTTTATIVFTDVVGSTELRTQLGEVASDELFRAHERQLATAVRAHRGTVVKSAGDGIMAAFDAASDGVAAAVAMQQAASRSTPPLSIRVGMASGDVSWQDGDCFGLPVVTAARLEAHATGGQILVSQVVRWLAGDRAGDRYAEVGPLTLKGLEEPVVAFEVGWDPVPVATGSVLEQAPLPAPLAAPGTFTLVGRQAEWATLVEAWHAAQAGAWRVVLLSGEAGAGKTRLAGEFARHCHQEGATVLFGGCDDQLSLPYQPWVQALDHLVRNAPVEFLADDPHGDAGELALLLPQLERVLPGAPRPPSSDPEADRYRLFTAVLSVLGRASAVRPLVLVLDDLHWAGAQTLALLRHLARSGGVPGLLVLGTFRDTGIELTDALTQCLADLRRVEEVVRVGVGGLDADGAAEFVAGAAGQDLDPDLRRVAADLAERSGGNAFYLGELWRHLVNVGALCRPDDRWIVNPSPDAGGVPESVKEVVTARLGRLTLAARAVIEHAAVGGRRTEERVLRGAVDLREEALGAALDELVDAGLLAEVSAGPLSYQFTHTLVRDTVEETIALRARARLHLAIAESLEAVYEADRRPVLADLARHFAAGSSFGGGSKAMYYGRRAGLQAMRSAAYDEAISHLASAVEFAPADSPERFEVLTELGRAQLRGGRYTDSGATFLRASQEAVAEGRSDRVAEAALGFEQACHMPGLPGDEAVALVLAAQETLADRSSPLHARLQAALARAYAHAGRLDDALAAVDDALVLARQMDDTDSQCTALEAALIATLNEPERVLTLARELTTLAGDNSDPWHLLYATSHSLRALVELGRLDEAARVLDGHRVHSDEFRYNAFQVVGLGFEVVLAHAGGRFGDAERAAELSLELSELEERGFGSGVYGLQMFAIRREQGRLAEVAPVLSLLSGRSGPEMGVWRPGLAALHAELDMLDEAREVFAQVAEDGFDALARDSLWPAAVSFLADAVTAIGDVERAGLVYEELVPWRDRNLMVGMTVCFGPADRYLGNLAVLLGRPDDAEAHYAAALALATRSRSPVWEAHARHDHARFLAATGRDAEAASLFAAAHAIAVELGMAALADRTDPERVGIVTPPVPELPDGLSGREVEVLRLVAHGSSNREIGEALHISQNTVANHVRAILQKTGCANRTEAAAYAARRQLLDA